MPVIACSAEAVSRAGSFASVGDKYPNADRKDGRGHEELRERNDGDVSGKADGGGAVKVVRHRKSQSHLHHRRDQQQFERAQADDGRAAHQLQRPLFSRENARAVLQSTAGPNETVRPAERSDGP